MTARVEQRDGRLVATSGQKGVARLQTEADGTYTTSTLNAQRQQLGPSGAPAATPQAHISQEFQEQIDRWHKEKLRLIEKLSDLSEPDGSIRRGEFHNVERIKTQIGHCDLQIQTALDMGMLRLQEQQAEGHPEARARAELEAEAAAHDEAAQLRAANDVRSRAGLPPMPQIVLPAA